VPWFISLQWWVNRVVCHDGTLNCKANGASNDGDCAEFNIDLEYSEELPVKSPKPISAGLNARLFQTLAQAERAGLPIEQSLKLCAEIGPDIDVAIANTRKRITGGASLADGGRRAGLWSGAEFEVIKAAEASGGLAPMFQRLADFHQLRLVGRQELRSGLIMPGILLAAALLIPPLPALVSGDLSLGQYVWNIVRAILSLGLVVVIAAQLPRLLRRWPTTAVAFDRLQVVMPLIGPWYFRRQMREFINTLALLLAAGIPAHEGVRLATPMTNSLVRRRVDEMSEALANGAGFADALATIEGINQQAVAMASSGEAAGKLDELLRHYSELENELTRRQERQLTTWLPRAVYLLVAGWAGWQVVTNFIG